MFVRLVGWVAVLALLVASCTPASSAVPKRVLLIAQERSHDMELVLNKEVGVMVGMLEEAGYQVAVASASGQPLAARGFSGNPLPNATVLKPDLNLSAVKADEYAGVVIPCMGYSDEAALYSKPAPVPPEAIEIVKKVASQGKPVAAQDCGVMTLAAAGLLNGKAFAIRDPWKQYVPDGVYEGTGLVTEGNIITSGSSPSMVKMFKTPDTTTDITQKLIEALEESR